MIAKVLFLHQKEKKLEAYFKYIFSLLSVLATVGAFAQEEQPAADSVGLDVIEYEPMIPRSRINYLYTPRVSLTVPHTLGNSSFKKTWLGIYEVNGSMNLGVYKNFYAGVVFKNGLLKINPKKVPNYNKVNGVQGEVAGMVMNAAAVRLGGDFYINEKNTGLFTFSIAAGQNSVRYTNLAYKDQNNPPEITSFKAIYVEPEVGIYLFVDRNFALGFELLYTYIDKTFDPYKLALNQWAPYSKTNSGATNYLSLGFGIYYGLRAR